MTNKKVPPELLWRITTIDAWQYHSPSDDLYLRFELKNETDHTSCDVTLPWTGTLITLMGAIEREVNQRMHYYMDGKDDRSSD